MTLFHNGPKHQHVKRFEEDCPQVVDVDCGITKPGRYISLFKLPSKTCDSIIGLIKRFIRLSVDR